MTAADPVSVPRRNAPVVVVGAGPCGLAAAAALKESGIPAIAFDKSCVVSAIVGYPTHLKMFSTAAKLEIGGVPFVSAGFRPTRRETIDYYHAVATERAVDIRQYEGVTAVARARDGFIVHTTPETGAPRETRATAIVIATGYFDYPNMLGVPGENLPHVSHRFVDGYSAFQRDVLVVGGGNSAVECALELAHCGARVTMVHHEAGFISHVIKPWILPDFEKRVDAGDISLRWSSRVTAIEPGRAHLQTGNETTTVAADLVYLMTGYTPRPGLLGELGVPFDATSGVPAHDPATMETTLPGVFIAGVLASGKKANGVFIENGRGHGALIAHALAGRRIPGS